MVSHNEVFIKMCKYRYFHTVSLITAVTATLAAGVAVGAVCPISAQAETVQATADVSGKAKTGPVETVSKEEQDTLADNNLEWGEIDALIHNYNATVVKNRNEWASDKRKTRDSEGIRDYLTGKADEYDALYERYQSDSAMLAASYKSSADSMRLQAESSVLDTEVIQLQYELIEKQTAETARTAFLNYYGAQYEAEYDAANKDYLGKVYSSTLNRRQQGMATEVDALTAKENADAASAALIAAGSSINNNRNTLTVMCGWRYDAEGVVIGALPQLSAESISAADYEADKLKAREANLTLRMDEIKLKNAKAGSYTALVVEQNQDQLNNDTQSFNINFKSAYDSMINACTAYANAVNDKAVADRNLVTADNQLSLGVISNIEYEGVKNKAKAAAYAERKAYISMLQAKAKYDAAVGGNL